jgi:hypothetical protein
MTDDRPTPRPPRRSQESPLVWGLLVAILLIAFVNSLVVAIVEPTTYRVVIALAAGACLVLSIVQLVRSSRERRRLRHQPPAADPRSAGDSDTGARGDRHGSEAGNDRPDDTPLG